MGAQVNVRSSILGEGGRAKEGQTEFLTLMEDAIRQPDLAKSVQRYQLAVDEAKVRLNLAVCPGAKAGMKLGINKSGTAADGWGPSKINPPNSHPSNPIHKDAIAAQSPWPDLKKMINKLRKTANCFRKTAS